MRIQFNAFPATASQIGSLRRVETDYRDTLEIAIDSKFVTERLLGELVAHAAAAGTGEPLGPSPAGSPVFVQQDGDLVSASGLKLPRPEPWAALTDFLVNRRTAVLADILEAYRSDKVPAEYDLTAPDWRFVPVPKTLRRGNP